MYFPLDDVNTAGVQCVEVSRAKTEVFHEEAFKFGVGVGGSGLCAEYLPKFGRIYFSCRFS